ncbi:MAG: transposase [Umezawaea sp.]
MSKGLCRLPEHRKLHRRIVNGTAKVTSATVKREAGRWYVSFCVQVEKQDRVPVRPDAVIGVDLGVRTLAVFSDGRPAVENPRHYDTACRKLGRLSRTVSRRIDPDRLPWPASTAPSWSKTSTCPGCSRTGPWLVSSPKVAGSGPETRNGRGADHKTGPGRWL